MFGRLPAKHAGGLLVTVTPAGNVEAFFREAAKSNAVPGPYPELWSPYGMELLGPPLPVEAW